MRHAVLGSGGVGGLLGAALTHAGADVVLLMRPETLARYPGELQVDSRVLGQFVVELPAASELDRDVDVLWVTVKAAGLSAALRLAPAARVGDACVIPLMNGVDHLALLRAQYDTVVAGAMRVESARLPDWLIKQSSPFIRVDLVGAEQVAADVRSAGLDCRVCDDEVSLLWQKLVFLAPFALATTAADAPLGSIRHDARYAQAQREALAVAQAMGAHIDVAALEALVTGASDTMRSSMQRDVDLGEPPEVDAIAGPILRGAHDHGLDVTATSALVDEVLGRVEQARLPVAREGV
jgi:2-dehydropantoate 2-reductase